MSDTLENYAAWQPFAEARCLSIKLGPDQNEPAENEVVISVSYVAINPSDWKVSTHLLCLLLCLMQPIDSGP